MNARTVAAVFAALVVGLAIGYVLGVSGDPAPIGGVRVVDDVRRTGPNDSSNTSELAASSDAERSAATSAAAEIALVVAERVRASAALPAAALELGVITGRVVDNNGAPVEGVDVRAVPSVPEYSRVRRPTGWNGGLEARPTLEAQLEKSAADWATARANEAFATSDANGAFTLPALGGEQGTDVTAGREGLSVTARGPDTRLEPGDTIEFVALRLAYVEFDVRTQDGTPIDTAVIERVEPYSPSYVEWRRGDPPRAYAPARVDVRAHVGLEFRNGKATSAAKSEVAVLELTEGEVRRVEFVVVPRTRVLGRVVEADGTPVVRELRLVHLANSGAPLDDQELATNGRPLLVRDGAFEALDLAPGVWEFGVFDRQSTALARAQVDVVPGTNELLLTVQPTDAPAELRVRILRPEGRQAHDVDFWAIVDGRSIETNLSGADGEGWRTLHLGDLVRDTADPWAKIESLRLSALDANTDASGAVDVPHRATEVELRLQSPAHLEVVVRGLVGTPFAHGTTVRAAWLKGYQLGSGEPSGARIFQPQGQARDGVFVFERLPSGTVDFELIANRTAGAHVSQGSVVAVVREVVGTGEQSIVMDFPSLSAVDVSAAKLAPGTTLRLVSLSEEPRRIGGQARTCHARLDDLSRARFEDVPAGPYRLECDDLVAPLTVDVPSAEIVIDGPVHDAQRVVVTSTAGALHAAGLRDGDLVIEARGAPLVSASRFDVLLAEREATALGVVVLRGGERVALDLSALLTTPRPQWGGTFARASTQP
jgi:hypothetical protein